MRRFTFITVLVAAMAVSLFGVLAGGGGRAEASGPVTITAFNGGENPPTNSDGTPSSTLSGPCAIPNVEPGVGGPPGFTINTANSGGAFPCGDGLNEYTNWNFYFASSTSDPVGKAAQYNAFLACVDSQTDPLLKLTSAKLTLQRGTPFQDTSTDGIAMLGKAPSAPANLSSGLQNTAIQAWVGSTLVHDWVASPGEPTPATNRAAILANLRGSGLVTPTNAPILVGSGNAIPFLPYNLPGGTIAMQYQDDALITSAELDLTCTPPPVGGVVDVLTGADGPAGNTLPTSVAVAAAIVAIAAGGWYTRKRWLP